MFFKIVRRFVAFVLAGAVILLLPLAMWISSAQGAFLNPDTYKNGLEEQNIYPDIASLALPSILRIAAGLQDDALIQLISSLPPDIRRQVTDELLPPDWVQAQMELGLDAFFGWLNSDAATLSSPLDIGSLQERLRGEAGERAIDLIITSSPPCTPEQNQQIQRLGTENPTTPIPACQPSEALEESLRIAMSNAMNRLALALETRPPTLSEVVGGPRANDNASLPALIEALERLQAVFYLCPAGLLALIVALVVRSYKVFGRWAGWIGIVSGFVAILPLPILSSQMIAGVTAEISQSQQPAEIQLFLVRLATGLLSSGFAQFSAPVVGQALLMVLVAIALLVTSSTAARQRFAPMTVADSPTVTVGRPPSTASTRRTGQLEKPEP